MKINFKRIIPVLAVSLLLTAPALAADTKIATIDLRKVFDNYWKRQQAEAALKERGSDLDKEYKSYVEDYNKIKEEYTKLLAAANDQSVTPEEREKRKTAAEAKLLDIKANENTIRTFEGNARDQLDTQKKRMRDTILQEIRAVINAKAKTGGYTMVIDTASESISSTPIVLFNTLENDMTEAILTQLNAGAPPAASAPSKDAPKTEEKKDTKK
jgi:outer membrane protein